jgi:beta-lactamase regulating signal transducer with metallopeptidase domain/protocatechuate 3,4-dioxygenase beta subunit
MSPLFDSIALWLADVHLLGGALLALVLPALLLLRQPAQRMAVAKSALAALAALVVLCALPGWSLVHLLSAEAPPAPVSVAAREPAAAPLTPPLVEYDPALDAFFAPVPPPNAVASPASTPILDEPALPSLSWPAALVLLQTIGSAAVVAWLAMGAMMVRRVRRASQPVSQELQQLLAELSRALSPPSLLSSVRVATPVALGLRRPVILLPADLATNPQRRTELPAILAHEYAHVAAGDLRTLALARLLLAIFWPQPLFWLLRRRIRFDQESLADAAAAEVAGRLSYAEQLVGWARTAPPRVPRLAGAIGLWEGPSQLKRRITLLLDEQLTILRHASRRWRIGTACAALVVAALLSLVTLQRQESAAQAVTELSGPQESGVVNSGDAGAMATEPNVIQGRAVDERGHPLSGVEVTLHRHTEWESDAYVQLDVQTTGADGAFRFANVVDMKKEFPNGLPNSMFLESPIQQFSILACRPGRAAARSSGVLVAFAAVERGLSVTLSLPPAVTLRGRVTGPDGGPVAGARVAVTSAGASNRGPVGDAFAATTDQDGNYSIENLAAFEAGDTRGPRQADSAPQGPLGTYRLLVEHPAYTLTAQDIASIPGDLDVQLQPGAVVEGTVMLRDRDGRETPAADVTVLTRRNTDASPEALAAMTANPVRTTKTDAVGRYRIESLSAGSYNVSAISKTWVTHGIESIEARPGVVTRAPAIVLTRGGVARLQLVDAKTGKPLSLPPGSQGYVSPMRLEPRTVTDFAQPIVQFSVDGVGRLPLPRGDFKFNVLVPGASPKSSQWMSVGYMSDPGPRRPITIDYKAIAEGETTNVTIRMERKSVTLGEADDASTDAEQRAPATTSFDVVPATRPADNQGSTADGILDALDPTGGDHLGNGGDGVLSFEETPADSKSREAGAAGSESSPRSRVESASGADWARSEPNVVKGRAVAPSSEPLAGVEVTLYRQVNGGSGNVLPEAIAVQTTGADGTFRFENAVDIAKEFPGGLPDERFMEAPVSVLSIVGRAPGRASVTSSHMAAYTAKRGAVQQMILSPAATLAGRVTDREGRPVAGAMVRFSHSFGGPLGDLIYAARTDAGGRYAITDLAPYDAAEEERKRKLAELAQRQQDSDTFSLSIDDSLRVQVRHPDFAVRGAKIFKVPGTADVQLLPASVIEGVVMTGDRTGIPLPAAGAVVTLMRELPENRRDPDIDLATFQSQRVLTDSAGRYQFGGLAAGSYTINAQVKGFVSHGLTGVKAAEGATASAPELVMTRGGKVRIKLVDADTKQPVSLPNGTRAYVHPYPSPQLPQSESMTFEDSVGELQLPPGRYALYVNVPGATEAEPSWNSVSSGGAPKPEHDVVEGETLEVTVLAKKKMPPRSTTVTVQETPLWKLTPAPSEAEAPAATPTLDFVPEPSLNLVPPTALAADQGAGASGIPGGADASGSEVIVHRVGDATPTTIASNNALRAAAPFQGSAPAGGMLRTLEPLYGMGAARAVKLDKPETHVNAYNAAGQPLMLVQQVGGDEFLRPADGSIDPNASSPAGQRSVLDALSPASDAFRKNDPDGNSWFLVAAPAPDAGSGIAETAHNGTSIIADGTLAAAPAGENESDSTEAVEASRPAGIPDWARREPNVVKGRAVDPAGQPLAGVEVTLYRVVGWDGGAPEQLAVQTTGPYGAFKFENVFDVAKEFPQGLPDDRFVSSPIKILMVVGRAPGRATKWSNDAAYRVVREGSGTQLVMDRAAALTGRVTARDGRPIANAVVRFFEVLPPAGDIVNVTRTDADGRYVITDLAPYDAAATKRMREEQAKQNPNLASWALVNVGMSVQVEHPDFATSSAAIPAIPGTVDLEMAPGSAIEGVVVIGDRTGVPLPASNVTVTLMRQMEPRTTPAQLGFQPVRAARVQTDGAGRYRFGSLTAGSYVMNAQSEGFVCHGIRDMKVGEGETLAAPEMMLTRGGTVRIKLVDANSNKPMALPDGTRGYVIPHPQPPLPTQRVVTFRNAEGDTQVPPGRYGFIVNIPGASPTDSYWQSVNSLTATPPEITHEVKEGETVEIEVPIKRQDQQAMATGTLQLYAPAATSSGEDDEAAQEP